MDENRSFFDFYGDDFADEKPAFERTFRNDIGIYEVLVDSYKYERSEKGNLSVSFKCKITSEHGKNGILFPQFIVERADNDFEKLKPSRKDMKAFLTICGNESAAYPEDVLGSFINLKLTYRKVKVGEEIKYYPNYDYFDKDGKPFVIDGKYSRLQDDGTIVPVVTADNDGKKTETTPTDSKKKKGLPF